MLAALCGAQMAAEAVDAQAAANAAVLQQASIGQGAVPCALMRRKPPRERTRLVCVLGEVHPPFGTALEAPPSSAAPCRAAQNRHSIPTCGPASSCGLVHGWGTIAPVEGGFTQLVCPACTRVHHVVCVHAWVLAMHVTRRQRQPRSSWIWCVPISLLVRNALPMTSNRIGIGMGELARAATGSARSLHACTNLCRMVACPPLQVRRVQALEALRLQDAQELAALQRQLHAARSSVQHAGSGHSQAPAQQHAAAACTPATAARSEGAFGGAAQEPGDDGALERREAVACCSSAGSRLHMAGMCAVQGSAAPDAVAAAETDAWRAGGAYRDNSMHSSTMHTVPGGQLKAETRGRDLDSSARALGVRVAHAALS